MSCMSGVEMIGAIFGGEIRSVTTTTAIVEDGGIFRYLRVAS